MKEDQKKLKFFTKSDLATRWEMSRQAVHQRSRYDPEFPEPYDVIQNGRLPIYLKDDIKEYEKKNPELLDPYFREAKIRWNYVNVVLGKDE